MTGHVIRHFLLGNDLFRDSLIKKMSEIFHSSFLFYHDDHLFMNYYPLLIICWVPAVYLPYS